jgi:hypothetical protein
MNMYTILCAKHAKPLNLFGDKIAFNAPGTDLEGDGGPLNLGLYLLQIRLPGTTGMVLRVAYRITGDRVFSAYIADPGHNKPSLYYSLQNNTLTGLKFRYFETVLSRLFKILWAGRALILKDKRRLSNTLRCKGKSGTA